MLTTVVFVGLLWPQLCESDIFVENQQQVKVSVYLDKVISVVDDQFLSIALDSGLIVNHWKSVNFSSERFNTLAKALSPAYLRVGGNAADFLIFQRKGGFGVPNLDPSLYEEDYEGATFKNMSQFNMSAQDYDAVNKFASTNGLHLLFDFNVLLRDDQGQWDSSNTREILEYSMEQGYDKNLLFSLGNEPNSFHHAFNRSISAAQLGKDFIALYNLLRNDPTLSPHFRNSLLVGPDVTQPKPKTLKYLQNFLDVAGPKINAVTFHQYYIDGRTATLDDMMSVDVLNILPDELQKLRFSMAHGGHANYTLWLGETSSCWGGGASGLSDRYVAGFMWLDKLGISAKNSVKVVVRQAYFHGHYALVDNDFYPNPDYWLSWLFKKLVGGRVFSTDVQGSDEVRLYAHCAQNTWYEPGAIVVYGMNLEDTNVTLSFDQQLTDLQKHLYWLYPYGEDGLKSEQVQLFGKADPLELVNDSTFPSVQPVVIPSGEDVNVGGQSFGFIVFPNAKASECL